MKRFDLVPVNLEFEEPVSVKDAYMEFHENYMVYSIEMKAMKRSDESMPWVESPVFFKDFILKSNIACVSKSWRDKLKRWHIRISISGVADDPYVWFKKQADCDEMMEYFIKWLELK